MKRRNKYGYGSGWLGWDPAPLITARKDYSGAVSDRAQAARREGFLATIMAMPPDSDVDEDVHAATFERRQYVPVEEVADMEALDAFEANEDVRIVELLGVAEEEDERQDQYLADLEAEQESEIEPAISQVDAEETAQDEEVLPLTVYVETEEIAYESDEDKATRLFAEADAKYAAFCENQKAGRGGLNLGACYRLTRSWKRSSRIATRQYGRHKQRPSVRWTLRDGPVKPRVAVVSPPYREELKLALLVVNRFRPVMLAKPLLEATVIGEGRFPLDLTDVLAHMGAVEQQVIVVR